MTSKRRRSSGEFLAHWLLADVPGGVKVYGTALAQAWMHFPPQARSELLSDYVAKVVLVLVRVSADDLNAAIDQSRQLVFDLIDVAGLKQPGSVCLLAAPRPAR